MRGKNSLKHSNSLQAPGPGSYNPDTSKVKETVSYRYTFSGRNPPLSGTLKGTPGPGSYQAETVATKSKSPSPIFGHAKRTDLINAGKNPGPGNYAPSINAVRAEAPRHG
eukprot:TRINITY_DN1795_c0_g7_i1.p2 TRINITY_DN1795_c0_g7~~TRINITY_DN1795_c0_g7_i1.p2  ORF type:complete len:110 (+),score=12.39 TRINITY_DN1795_c0_g7_i1:381-710(+)